jgi:hypothetical protein
LSRLGSNGQEDGLFYVLLPVSRFLPWHLLTLFPGFREPDRYCLLPAFDLATPLFAVPRL